MELVGIVLSVPVALILSALYIGLLRKFIRPHERLRTVLQSISLVAVGLIVIEAALVLTAGSVRLRQALGPPYYAFHLLLFVIAVPALANVLALRPLKMNALSALGVSAACAVFALPVVLLQVAVSEDLYGVDGDNGPFSAGPMSGKAVIDDVTSGRAQLLTVDGQEVERATSQYVTAIPMAVVTPGRHVVRVRLRAAELGWDEKTR